MEVVGRTNANTGGTNEQVIIIDQQQPPPPYYGNQGNQYPPQQNYGQPYGQPYEQPYQQPYHDQGQQQPHGLFGVAVGQNQNQNNGLVNYV